MLRKNFLRLAIIIGSVLTGLLIAEGIIRVFPHDWRILRRILPYMDKELETHMANPDPRIVVSLKPNSTGNYEQHFGPFKVTVNSLGFRGAERTADKPPGVFRILCIGGSNVYGAGINDNETWPAQLESKLNLISSTSFEVWNMGVSGYNSIQMCAVSENAIERYDPDMIIFALSNIGPRFFLAGTNPVRQYFHKDPSLWQEIIPHRFLEFPNFLSVDAKLWMLNRVGLYRALVAGMVARNSHERIMIHPYASPHYVETTHECLLECSKKVPMVVFICPAVEPAEAFDAYYSGIDVPVFSLSAKGKPAEYREYHPPVKVMTWYAENLAKWFVEHGYVAGEPEKTDDDE